MEVVDVEEEKRKKVHDEGHEVPRVTAGRMRGVGTYVYIARKGVRMAE